MYNTHTQKNILNKIILFFVLFTFVTSITIGPFGVKITQAGTQIVAPSTTPNTPPNVGLDCGFLHLDECAAEMGEYMFYEPANMLLVVAGSIFDSMLSFSLSNSVINQPFVMDTWRTVRDIANISFIFVLLYIAIATILNLGDYKKLLTNLIIIALIINFSAFFTKIVIDASNIIALQFYNAISVGVPSGTDVNLSVPEKRISNIFVKGFDPQRMMRSDAVQNWKKSGNSLASLFFVFLAAGVVTFVASFVLFMAGFLMLGRVVAFWFLIMASPIAFVAIIIPGARGLFSKWSGHLINQALVAPVFLFFMYVIAQIVGSNFLKNIFNNSATDILSIITNIVLVFSALLMTLLMALDVTKKLSGTAGAMATKFGGATRAVGMIKSGAASGAKYTSGRVASRISNSRKLKSLGRKMPGVGMALDATLNKMGAGKHDKRMKEREKRKTAYGAKVTNESKGERIMRLREEGKINSRKQTGEKELSDAKKKKDASTNTEELHSAEKLIKIAEKRINAEEESLKRIKDSNREQKVNRQQEHATSLENPGRIAKIIQKATGEEAVDRETAAKIRKDGGKESDSDKIKKLGEKIDKLTNKD